MPPVCGESSELSCAMRWQTCRNAAVPDKFIIGLAAEADPLARIDEDLLTNNPQAILEGLLIAAYAAGAGCARLYINQQTALDHLQNILDQSPCLSKNPLLDSNFSCRIELLKAPDNLPAQDSTRVISMMAGRQPENCSGIKQLQPDRHYVIHSIETLMRLTDILNQGASWYADLGHNGHRGCKMLDPGRRCRPSRPD